MARIGDSFWHQAQLVALLPWIWLVRAQKPFDGPLDAVMTAASSYVLAMAALGIPAALAWTVISGVWYHWQLHR